MLLQLGDGQEDTIYGLSGCWGGSTGLTQYLNRDDVRAAIHVKTKDEMISMCAAIRAKRCLFHDEPN